ncbi:aldolase [Nocardioides sp. YIM 152315]|uniref:aldolase n=1 Tax=Nocardioides sp. YIM 152315 TaxID=3031760 RepID=UPI0023DC46AA|nr:aldolase [Nocardioides sp. YIM 152315]MDF1605775.1 aldolase [Nocardioides sp. YIM 152315]
MTPRMTPRVTLDAIARPGGGFAMVAMDQRESLRTMFDDAGAGRPADPVLTDFKLEVARALGPLASGFLVDRHYGFERVRDEGLLPDGCGLILAADELTQEDGGPVMETALDEIVLSTDLGGVSALKLLVIWRRDELRPARVDLARRFAEEARARGVLSVLEPVVRATPDEEAAGTWDLDEAIREAARELSPVGADLYKVQVPSGGRGSDDELLARCRELAADITGPWVVLSQGVDRDDFLRAVTTACRAGASGFLAGRALWSDLVGTPDLATALREVSVPRLERLCEVVDAHARPWREAR